MNILVHIIRQGQSYSYISKENEFIYFFSTYNFLPNFPNVDRKYRIQRIEYIFKKIN